MAVSIAAAEVKVPHQRPLKYGRAAKIRIVVLSTVMCVLLGALWYDYQVARGSVDRAYESVMLLNQAKNEASDFSATTQRDVRRMLHRQPSRIYQEGPFTVELYSWTAGVPFEFEGLYSETPSVTLRTHDYYAVYLGTRLSTHYKYYLPLDEVRKRHAIPAPRSDEEVALDYQASYDQAREYLEATKEHRPPLSREFLDEFPDPMTDGFPQIKESELPATKSQDEPNAQSTPVADPAGD